MGLYDSGDPDTLECQVLLMKITGLDGVIIDWYGTKDFNDYAMIHRNTQAIIPWLKKAGMKFALCYEDQAVKAAVTGSAIPINKSVAQGMADLKWAEDHWFNDPSYVRQNNSPLLLVFGPQHFVAEEWKQLRAGLKSNPVICGLPHLAESTEMNACFGWIPVTGGKNVQPEDWKKELETLASRGAKDKQLAVATCFPGFHDFYQQAGVHASYGNIDDQKGATLLHSFGLAQASGAPIIQIATWNDYGEGTMIEPTRNVGYRSLEALQLRTTESSKAKGALRLPVMLYHLRKRLARDATKREELDKVSAMLFAGEFSAADIALQKIGVGCRELPAEFPDAPKQVETDYRLLTDLPYRSGPDVSESMKLHCRMDLYFPANVKSFPTVIYFHGGGLTNGHRSVPLGLRGKGIGVVAVDYRLSPSSKAPTFIEDAAAATAWTLQNIGNYGGNPKGVFLSGHSAGGYLSAMVGLDKRWLAAYKIDANDLAGLIPLSPQAITHFTIRGERGINEKQPIIDEMAPLFHVRKDAPPMLIVTGDREKELLGRYEENAYFWRMMKVAGHPDISLTELKTFGHGDMAEPGLPLVLDFIKTHTKDSQGPAK